MRHPAHNYPYEVLITQLMARVEQGLIKRKEHGHLALFHYSEECMYSKKWDDFTMMARGLIIDTTAMKLVATPFPKFFNYGEQANITLPDEPFIAYEKLDGSLGIAFHHDDAWHIVTKGSFTSTQAVEGWHMLRELPLNELMPGCTYLFEIVGPWNRIIVPYAKSELVLLGAYMWNGQEIGLGNLLAIARDLGVRFAATHQGKSIDDLVAIAKELPRDDEGFVVRFESGYRVKIKGAAYVRAHKLASRVTPLGVYDAMVADDDLDALRRELPEELWPDFDAIRTLLAIKVGERVNEFTTWHHRTHAMSMKELGLSAEVPHRVKWMLFAARNGKKFLVDPKTRRTFFEAFRPTGNVLEGYSPSNSLNRFQET